MKLYLLLIIYTLSWVTDKIDPELCGNRPLMVGKGNSGVVGKKNAQPGSWPWIVSIQKPVGKGYRHICGGIILNKLWVLTAAHCFTHQTSEHISWRLVVGTTHLSKRNPETEIRAIKKTFEPGQYNPKQQHNDISLVMVNETINYNAYIQPACLPTTSSDLYKMTDCIIAGWGITKAKTNKSSNVLQEAQVSLVPNKQCKNKKWCNGTLNGPNLCAGNGIWCLSRCQIDSGGPLMCRMESEEYFVIGIASRGPACTKKQSPGFYTSTKYFHDWILKTISREATIESRSLRKPMKKTHIESTKFYYDDTIGAALPGSSKEQEILPGSPVANGFSANLVIIVNNVMDFFSNSKNP